MNNIFDEISDFSVLEYDSDTKQYCFTNDKTPWIYWIWDSKSEAIEEYLLSLWDLILINLEEKNDRKINTLA